MGESMAILPDSNDTLCNILRHVLQSLLHVNPKHNVYVVYVLVACLTLGNNVIRILH